MYNTEYDLRKQCSETGPTACVRVSVCISSYRNAKLLRAIVRALLIATEQNWMPLDRGASSFSG